MTTFTALVTHLPTRDSTIRMRVWRSLRASGCGILRDGVYLLPPGAPTLGAFAEVEEQVRAAGGMAMTVGLEFASPAQLAHARGLFDRSEAYRELVEEARRTKASLAKLGERKARTAAGRLERALEELAAVDFFPGEARRQAEEMVRSVVEEARRGSAGEPHAGRGRIKRVDRDKYRGRTWATRASPWVDRLASAWLIRRFVDKEARFAWLESPARKPRGAVGFDFDGADFTHVGNRVTFEVLVASFGLDADPALASIAAMVHFLDAGGIPVADARGLETLLRGIREKARSDDDLLSKACTVFDHFYTAYSTG